MPGLLHTEVSSVLVTHVLPQLDAKDLGCLAATCKHLRQLLEAVQDIWQQAAKRTLPWHLSLPASVSEIRAALDRHATVHRNLARGTYRVQHLGPDFGLDRIDCATLSPDLSTWAFLARSPDRLCFSPRDLCLHGKSAPRIDSELGGFRHGLNWLADGDTVMYVGRSDEYNMAYFEAYSFSQLRLLYKQEVSYVEMHDEDALTWSPCRSLVVLDVATENSVALLVKADNQNLKVIWLAGRHSDLTAAGLTGSMSTFLGVCWCQWLPGCNQVAGLMQFVREQVLGVWDLETGVLLKAQHLVGPTSPVSIAINHRITVLQWQPDDPHCLQFLCRPDWRPDLSEENPGVTSVYGVCSGTGAIQELAAYDGYWVSTQLAPDGSVLAACLYQGLADHESDLQILHVASLTTTEPACQLDGDCSMFSWAPDSRWLGALRLDLSTHSHRVSITDTLGDAGTLDVILKGEWQFLEHTSLQWAPDGSQLAIWEPAEGTYFGEPALQMTLIDFT